MSFKMNLDPESYAKNNSIQSDDAADILEEFNYLFKEPKSTVMDIGCGTGNVTWNLLRPRLSSSSRIIGTDIDKAVLNYAQSQYPDLGFLELDISTFPIPENLRSGFDFVFSNYCLQWCDNQRIVMENIFSLLSPGGKTLLIYPATHPYYDVVLKIRETDPWKSYMSNMANFVSPYHFSHENAENELRKILKDTGFNVEICECRKKNMKTRTLQVLKDHLLAVLPFYSKVLSYNLRENFGKDLENMMWNIFKKYGTCENITLPYKIIVILASKPIEK